MLKFAGVLLDIDIRATFFNLNRQNTVILVKFIIQVILFTFILAYHDFHLSIKLGNAKALSRVWI